MSADDEQLIGRSYTRARRHPLVIGKLPGAGRLPGGPYTITQIVTMVVMFLLLVITRQLWARFGVIDILVLAALPWGTAWALRYARLDGRDPARALRSLLVYASSPAGGRLAGSPQRQRRPQLALATCTVHVRTPTAAAPTPPGPARVVPAPTATTTAIPCRPLAESGLQALLASLPER